MVAPSSSTDDTIISFETDQPKSQTISSCLFAFLSLFDSESFYVNVSSFIAIFIYALWLCLFLSWSLCLALYVSFTTLWLCIFYFNVSNYLSRIVFLYLYPYLCLFLSFLSLCIFYYSLALCLSMLKDVVFTSSSVPCISLYHYRYLSFYCSLFVFLSMYLWNFLYPFVFILFYS